MLLEIPCEKEYWSDFIQKAILEKGYHWRSCDGSTIRLQDDLYSIDTFFNGRTINSYRVDALARYCKDNGMWIEKCSNCIIDIIIPQMLPYIKKEGCEFIDNGDGTCRIKG